MAHLVKETMDMSMFARTKRYVDDSSNVTIHATDFNFVGYPSEGAFLGSGRNRVQYFPDTPSIDVYSNAIYTPATQRSKPFDGCIYDEQGSIIENSFLRRGLNGASMTTEPSHYGGPTDGLPRYERPLLYLGYVNWHYGHFLIETLAKWWAVSEAIGEVDGFLFHVHDPQLFQKPFIQACMVGMQLEQKEIVHFNQPTLLSKVIVPQSSFQLDGHIYAKYRDTLSVIASAYFAPGSKRTEQPLYVSRRLLKGGVTQYVGEADIEDFLAKKGVRIFHPQMHAFEEQVRIFNEHAVILGIDGSGMHNIALSIDPKTAVYFTQDWIIPSSLLISRCFDAKSTFLYSSARFDRFRALSEKLSSKLPLNWHRPSDGFLRTRHLDVSRVLTWLKQSDIV